MPRFKDQAICIRHLDWSESSQIVSLLTEDHGKIRGLAKGAKRMSPSGIARFSGGVDLLTAGEVVATTRPTTELATLTEWDLQEPFPHLHEHLGAMRLAMYAADVTNALLAEDDPHPEVYTALGQFLRRLAEPESHAGALLRFQWSLLVACGYRPALDIDVVLNEALPARATYTFEPVRGGFTSTGEPVAHGVWGVRHETVELLRTAATGTATGTTRSVQRANQLLCAYMRMLLDRQLPTMDFVLGK